MLGFEMIAISILSYHSPSLPLTVLSPGFVLPFACLWVCWSLLCSIAVALGKLWIRVKIDMLAIDANPLTFFVRFMNVSLVEALLPFTHTASPFLLTENAHLDRMYPQSLLAALFFRKSSYLFFPGLPAPCTSFDLLGHAAYLLYQAYRLLMPCGIA